MIWQARVAFGSAGGSPSLLHLLLLEYDTVLHSQFGAAAEVGITDTGTVARPCLTGGGLGVIFVCISYSLAWIDEEN
ncbi:hypothetical protein HOY82DRAFT_549690 [Tuber indicum]|nr:hypothetical protein HOY82DRAFT_549690 [Tuber indicum]